jgi:hypothetical protein
MAQYRRPTPNKRQASRLAPQTRSLARPPLLSDLPQRVVYGKAFILMEDAEKNTFVYKAGAWVPYEATIAECRQTCQVKALPQGVGKMTRYEVRAPEDA